MTLYDLFDEEFQQTLRDANSSMESMVMIANDMLTPDQRNQLLEITARIEKELQGVTDKEFRVRLYVFPTLYPTL